MDSFVKYFDNLPNVAIMCAAQNPDSADYNYFTLVNVCDKLFLAILLETVLFKYSI